MLNAFVTRLTISLIAALGAALFAFITLRVAAGDPARLFLGPFATEQAVENLRDKMGLNDPLYSQFFAYMADFFTGNWGRSYSLGENVATLLADRFPATIELGLAASLFAFVATILTGATISFFGKPLVSRVGQGLAIVSIGVPQFWFGIVALMVGYERLGLFPAPTGRLAPGVAIPPDVTGLYTVDALFAGQLSTFAQALSLLALPALTLALLPFGYLLRLLVANLEDVKEELFIIVFRSRGLSEAAVFWRYVLPNAIVPTLTASGLIFGQLLAGSVLVERIFNWPGAGALVAQGILQQDFSVVQTFILLSAMVCLFVNFLFDMLVAYIDPRFRKGAS